MQPDLKGFEGDSFRGRMWRLPKHKPDLGGADLKHQGALSPISRPRPSGNYNPNSAGTITAPNSPWPRKGVVTDVCFLPGQGVWGPTSVSVKPNVSRDQLCGPGVLSAMRDRAAASSWAQPRALLREGLQPPRPSLLSSTTAVCSTHLALTAE